MRTQAELAAATSEVASLKEQLLEHLAQENSLQACLQPQPFVPSSPRMCP